MSEDLAASVRATGRRLTPARARVLAAVRAQPHATPDELLATVSADGGPPLPPSTVYRNLEVLQELGLVSHTHIDHRAPGYHLASHAGHLHLSCRACGWTGEAPAALAAPLAQELARSVGFVADLSHAAIHGLCADCAALADAPDSLEEDEP